MDDREIVGHFVSLAPVVAVSPSVTQSAEQAEPAQARNSVSMGHLAYTTIFLTSTHILTMTLMHQMMYVQILKKKPFNIKVA